MAVSFFSSNDRPYSHSRRWRMKFNYRRHTTAIAYRQTDTSPRLVLTLGNKQRAYTYDEYLASYYASTASGPYPFREIPARLVSHEIGDSESDYLLTKVIVDCQYDIERFGDYTYDPLFPDPVINVELRSTTYEGQTPTKVIDLVSLNQTAMPSTNPFVSARQTPGPTPISADDIAAARESLALVAPMERFRRSRLEITTPHKVTTVRSLQVIYTEFPRRTWG